MAVPKSSKLYHRAVILILNKHLKIIVSLSIDSCSYFFSEIRSHGSEGHMRLKVNLLSLCPCNNISFAFAIKQIQIALTWAFVGPNDPFSIKYKVKSQYTVYYWEGCSNPYLRPLILNVIFSYLFIYLFIYNFYSAPCASARSNLNQWTGVCAGQYIDIISMLWYDTKYHLQLWTSV